MKSIPFEIGLEKWKYEDVLDGCIRTEKRLHFVREQANRR